MKRYKSVYSPCNYTSSLPHCHGKTSDSNNLCNSHNVCYNAIRCVSDTQRSIANFLNHTGKNLQNVIACSDDVNVLLCANRKATDAIVKATHIEHELYHILTSNKSKCYNTCFNHCCSHLT